MPAIGAARPRTWTEVRGHGIAALHIITVLALLLGWQGGTGQAAQGAADLTDAHCQEALARDAASRIVRLLQDCVTNVALDIPDGWIFTGDGHTVYAQDPSSGRLATGVLRIAQGTATVRDVTVDGRGLTQPCRFDLDAVVSAILFTGSSGTVERVHVQRFARPDPAGSEPLPDYQRQACGVGVRVTGSAANVTISDNTLADLGFAGMLIDAGTATVSRNEIRRAAVIGVFAVSGARVRVTPENQIRDSSVGVQFEGDGTSGRIAGNVIAHMSSAGIVVINGAQASIAENAIEDIADTGISVKLRSRATVTETRIQRTDYGIAVQDGVLEASETTVTSSRVCLVSFSGGEITVRDSTTSDCAFGMGAAGGQTTIQDSTISGSNGVGIQAELGGAVEAQGVQVALSDVGVRAQGGSRVTMTGSEIRRTAKRGMVIMQGSQVTLAQTRLVDPGEFGILVTDPGSSANISDTLVSGATVRSVEASGGAQMNAARVRVYGGVLGVAVMGMNTVADISDSFISGGGTNVSVVDGAHVTLTGLFSTGGKLGVGVRGPGARAIVRDSTIQQATMNGVQATEGAWASIEQSRVLDTMGTGVLFRKDDDPAPSLLLQMNAAGCVQDELVIPADAHAFLTVQNQDVQFRSLVVDEMDLTLEVPPAAQRGIELGGEAGSFRIQCKATNTGPSARTAVLRFLPADEVAMPRPQQERLVVKGSVIQGGEYGVYAHGPALLVTLSEDTITGVTRDGVVVSRRATANIRDTVIGETGEAGIEVREGAQATLNANTISDVATRGIWALGAGTTAAIMGNTISETGIAGIAIGDAAKGTVWENTVNDGGSWGIQAYGHNTSVNLRNNSVTGGVVGIAVSDGASASVAANTVLQVQETGVVVANATASLTGNTIREPGSVGVQARSQATLLALRNEISGNEATSLTGIRAEPGVRGSVQENVLANFGGPGSCGLDLPLPGSDLDIGGNVITPAVANLLCRAATPVAPPQATPRTS